MFDRNERKYCEIRDILLVLSYPVLIIFFSNLTCRLCSWPTFMLAFHHTSPNRQIATSFILLIHVNAFAIINYRPNVLHAISTNLTANQQVLANGERLSSTIALLLLFIWLLFCCSDCYECVVAAINKILHLPTIQTTELQTSSFSSKWHTISNIIQCLVSIDFK